MTDITLDDPELDALTTNATSASGTNGNNGNDSGTGTGTEPRIDVADLGERLLGAWKAERLAGRAKAASPEYQFVPDLTMAEHRERVFGQLKLLVDDGAVNIAFPKSVGGQENHGGNIAGFEELVLADPSLQIKAGVQWGLFGAAVMHLGTEYHHTTFLPDIMSLKVPGVYAMTETGHGSDVASIGTTATYDEATEEWVIHTPFRGAWKDYGGNAGTNGKAAVVFAQLITKNVNHGVHAFYVPIRDDEGNYLTGIGGEDDGYKGGLNGIDNGRLHFTNVRVPRRNLLNRYGDVAADGTYSSDIESPGRRFFTMLGTIVQGRVSLDGSANAAAKAALAIAVRYGNERRQFAGADGEEMVLLDYQLHQRRLLPRLATTYAIAFAHERLLRQFHGVFSGELDTPEQREDLETLAAALKPLSTWHGLDTLQECREACGGAGFLAENRFPQLYQDLDVYATFEGDNHVLLQLVGKRLLTDFSEQFRGADARKTAQIMVGKVALRIFAGTGLRQAGQNVVDFGSVARSAGALRQPQEQYELLSTRVRMMVEDIALGIGRSRNKSKAEQAETVARYQHRLIEAARAHGELLQWEAFTDALEDMPEGGTKRVLTWVRDLFGLGLIEKHLEWYLINGQLSGQRANTVSRYIDRLVDRIRPHAQDLVDAFGYGQDHLRAAIATGAEKERQDEARAYVQAQREAGTLPITEKELRKRARRAGESDARVSRASASPTGSGGDAPNANDAASGDAPGTEAGPREPHGANV